MSSSEWLYTNSMEQPHISVGESLSLGLRAALVSGDVIAVKGAIEQDSTNPVLENIGLRLKVRDLWLKRKEQLAGLDTFESTNETSVQGIQTLIETMDSDLLSIIGMDQNGGLDTTNDVHAMRINRLKHELSVATPAVSVGMLKRFSEMPTEDFATSESIINKTIEWRGQIVEMLWSPVQSFRETLDRDAPEVRQEIQSNMSYLTDQFDVLISDVMGNRPK